MLALSNFEGNDSIILSQYMNKCNPHYLWIVMRNNIWLMLKENYQDYLAERPDPQKGEAGDETDRISIEAWKKQTFSKLNKIRIAEIIEQEKQKKGIF